MDINTAKSVFMNILNSLNDEYRSQFLSWCEQHQEDISHNQAYIDLRVIAEDIKTIVPTEAILPSEKIDHAQIENNTMGYKPVIHVDSFLYEEEHVDALESEGKISRNFCQKCGSTDVSPITFISHSASIKRMEYIFKKMLPDLTNKVVLDVGSRLGAILYGAYYYSSACKIIGVEINKDLCELQKHIVGKYNLSDRIEVICNNICNVPEVIKSANVIIFNNVFQCFLSKHEQEYIWQWLRNTMTVPGTIVITVPSMEETLSNLETGIDVSSWLRKVSTEHNSMEDADEMDDPDLLLELCCYVVI